MKPKNCLIFGASGQIGRHLIRKLTKNNYIVTAVTRNIHQKGYILKTQANAGYLDIVEVNIFDENKLKDLIKKTDICINLIGILFESNKGNTFKNIHITFPALISRICKDQNVKQFIHLSALGIDQAKDSNYALSKTEGEIHIKKNFSNATILRPSLVYSVDDNATTNFMTLLNRMPIFPIFGNPNFVPIHVSDLVEIIYQVISKEIKTTTIECIGPEVISFKEILEKLLILIEKKRLFIKIPLFLAKILAKFFQLFPKPLITEDQLRLLSYNNVVSGKYKTNFDIGIPSQKIFIDAVQSYSHMWRDRGEFSKKKFNLDGK